MGMYERLGCAVFLEEGRSSPPHCSPFLWFWLEMVIFGLMCLGNDIEILHINLHVFGLWVREKGEGVRTRKSSWNKKL
jgi:hypothetical protein